MATEAQRHPDDAWDRAQQLEREDRLDEAEQTILRAIDHLGAYAQVARLYELRMLRLQSMGDDDGAAHAFRASDDWMRQMASGATSGGEGAALSLQADRHRARLVAALGHDPDRPPHAAPASHDAARPRPSAS